MAVWLTVVYVCGGWSAVSGSVYGNKGFSESESRGERQTGNNKTDRNASKIVETQKILPCM